MWKALKFLFPFTLFLRSNHTYFETIKMPIGKKIMGMYWGSWVLKRPQKTTKPSPLIWHLLSKRRIESEDLIIFCGLFRKHELQYIPIIFFQLAFLLFQSKYDWIWETSSNKEKRCYVNLTIPSLKAFTE